MNRLAIIDGDPIVYSAAFALQKYALSDLTCNGHIIEIFDSKKEAKTHAEDLGLEQDEYELLDYADATEQDVFDFLSYALTDVVDITESEEVEIWLSSKTNFRKTIDPEYKAHRADKPILHNLVRSVMEEQFGAITAEEDYEADDEIAEKATQMREHGQEEDYIICSIDKDLDTVPGWHYNWPIFNREGNLYFVEPEQARHIFWISVLTGDAADNIPGLHGVGPKKAEKQVVGCNTDEEYFESCKKAYFAKLDQDMSEDEILERLDKNIKLLTIGKGELNEQPNLGSD